MSGIKLLLSSIVAILICSLPLSAARAESPSPAAATISGQIVDQTGAAIPGATVTFGSQSERAGSLTSKADGTFTIEGVAPGIYVIKVEISGFDTYQNTVIVGQEPIAPLKITLRVRSLETDVTVEADEPADAFSTSASNGATMRMDDEFRRSLPIVADDFLGVVANFFYPGAQGSQGASVIVDGFQGDQIEVPSAAIGAVRLNRNPYSAFYQHPGQARIEVSTKRGRRSRYDAMFEMSERNDLFAARNAFAPETQELGRRLVQPTLAGPLPGKKSSFFFSGQYFVHDESAVVNAETQTGPVVANVPTSHDHNSLFTRIQAWPNELQTIAGTYGFSGHD
jgi:Carboxypeptidase regulatory-like domain